MPATADGGGGVEGGPGPEVLGDQPPGEGGGEQARGVDRHQARQGVEGAVGRVVGGEQDADGHPAAAPMPTTDRAANKLHGSGDRANPTAPAAAQARAPAAKGLRRPRSRPRPRWGCAAAAGRWRRRRPPGPPWTGWPPAPRRAGAHRHVEIEGQPEGEGPGPHQNYRPPSRGGCRSGRLWRLPSPGSRWGVCASVDPGCPRPPSASVRQPVLVTTPMSSSTPRPGASGTGMRPPAILSGGWISCARQGASPQGVLEIRNSGWAAMAWAPAAAATGPKGPWGCRGDAPGGGHGGHLVQLGDASDDGDVGHGHVEGAPVQHLPPAAAEGAALAAGTGMPQPSFTRRYPS